MNDPNGPIERDGLVHLFFQSRTTVDHDEPVSWGHATSPDYAHWTLHRPAMAPLPAGLDSDGCWSGNVIEHDGALRAFYSGLVKGSQFQSVLAAVSHDGGASFAEPSVVMTGPEPGERISMFRDPFVWRDGDRWLMVVGSACEDGRAAVRLYESDDLEQWSFRGNCAEVSRQTLDGVDSGEGWECPQVIPLDGQEYMIVGGWAEGEIGYPLAFALREGGGALAKRIDYGQNLYVTGCMREGQYGPVVFGWVTEGRDSAWWQADGWAGAISIARQVWVAGDGSLRFKPVPTLESLRLGAVSDGADVEVGAQFEAVLPHHDGELVVQFGGPELLRVTLDIAGGVVRVDRSAASLDPRAHGGVAAAQDAFDPASGLPAVRVFVDGSIVEVFTSAGRVLTTRVYPTSAPPWRVRASAGGEVWALSAGAHAGRTVAG